MKRFGSLCNCFQPYKSSSFIIGLLNKIAGHSPMISAELRTQLSPMLMTAAPCVVAASLVVAGSSDFACSCLH